ncbi:MAG TPA: O-antigen ligase family protein [Verrucomicrobiae bacterium]
MKAGPPSSRTATQPPLQGLFGALFGGFLGLALLKFGNPPIMEKWVSPPGNALEFFLGSPWPISWAYGGLGLLVLVGVLAGHWRLDYWTPVLFLPLVWLGWQIAASTRTIDSQLSHPTVIHFLACCACFYLGRFCLGRKEAGFGLLMGLTIGFLLALATGFEQRFGGLDQTRQYFFTYIYPQLDEVPPDYLKKMSSDRIFSTLFYPNAFAGAILLLTPPVLGFISSARRRLTLGARIFLVGAVGAPAVACLYWSGSKGGWLLLLALAFVALLRVRFDRRIKVLLVGCVLVAGLGAFGLKYVTFFRKGATSVVARFDYWTAAVRTAVANPLLGTGPGTFAKPYQALKKPESEMARLVHNDYLEQASDSGWVGFAAYTAFIVAALVYGYPRVTGWLPFSIWLGVLGWALQSLIEFGLYLPALAWPAFTFLGLLLAPPQAPEASNSHRQSTSR